MFFCENQLLSTRKIKRAGTTATAKSWILVVSQVSCCGFCPVLWPNQRGAYYLTCMWPSLSHIIKLMQASLLCTLADTATSQDFWWKKPRRRPQGSIMPQLHPCTGLSSREKRAEESEPLAGWTLWAERGLVPLFQSSMLFNRYKSSPHDYFNQKHGLCSHPEKYLGSV